MGFIIFLIVIAALVMLVVNPVWLRSALRELFVCWPIAIILLGILSANNPAATFAFCVCVGAVIAPFIWCAYRVVRFVLQSNKES
jgi:hypothetical protein